MATELTFPGNLPSVATQTDLREVPVYTLSANALYVTRGRRDPGDGFGGIWTYSPSSTDEPNGVSVLLPLEKELSQPGRWMLVVGSNDETIPGVPVGGDTGQVLTKLSDEDYDTAWQDAGSTVNAATLNDEPGPFYLDRINHTGTQLASTISNLTEAVQAMLINAATVNGNNSAFLLARANHTGTQTAATISDLTESVQDTIAATLVQGANILLTYDDVAGTLTIDSTGGGGGGGGGDASTLQGQNGAYYRSRANHTGTQPASTITGLAAVATSGSAADLGGILSNAQLAAFTGDVTKPEGSGALTLATVNSNTGTFGGAETSPQIAVDGKGRITQVSAITIEIPFARVTLRPTTLAGYGITDAQGLNANLTAIAGQSTVANRLTYWTGTATAALATLTAAGRDWIAAANVAAQTAILNVFTDALKGLVPASGGGTTNFLRADGTWAAPGGGGGVPAAGAIGDFITAGSTSHASGTSYLPGTTVAGSTLVYHTSTGLTGSLSGDPGNGLTVSVGANASFGFSGTWELRSRVERGAGGGSGYPVGLWKRIA